MAARRTTRLASDPEDLRPNTGAIARGIGGRLSIDSQFDLFGMPNVLVPPSNAEDQWRFLSLDNDALRRISPARLMELLADLSPDVSRALWDFLRLCNPGWTVKVTRPGGTDVDAKGQQMADDFLNQLQTLYGSVDVVFGRMFISAFLRGAIMAELVLDLDGKTMVDFATPDPASVRYVRKQDPVRGHIYVPVQWQNRALTLPVPLESPIAGFIPLTWPTIRIVPIDPFPGSPYGRAMAAPALFSTLFLLGMLHDLRRVVSQQGYPRLDASIDLMKLKASAPASITSDPAKWKKWVKDSIDEVTKLYEDLQPDDMFTHTDVVTLNRPVGTVDSSSLGAVDGLIQALERMSTRALKTMPFMQGSTQSTTETQAVREWEMMTQSIRSTQHFVESLTSGLLELGLQAQGVAADVSVEFAELRASEEIRDATAEGLRVANAAQKYSWGWISQDAAAQAGANVDEADAPAPRILPRGATETTDADAAQLAPEIVGGSGDGGNGQKRRTRARRAGGDDAVTVSAKPTSADKQRVTDALDYWATETDTDLWDAVEADEEQDTEDSRTALLAAIATAAGALASRLVEANTATYRRQMRAVAKALDATPPADITDQAVLAAIAARAGVSARSIAKTQAAQRRMFLAECATKAEARAAFDAWLVDRNTLIGQYESSMAAHAALRDVVSWNSLTGTERVLPESGVCEQCQTAADIGEQPLGAIDPIPPYHLRCVHYLAQTYSPADEAKALVFGQSRHIVPLRVVGGGS
ncbi:MAG: hypothetical protein JWP44_4544 [Mucilaginibacter sp.]|nr:hypothetical protein [Mucilaginibacter sp.]